MNRRLLAPKASALAKLSYTPSVSILVKETEKRKAGQVHVSIDFLPPAATPHRKTSNPFQNASAELDDTASFDPVIITS